jgi:ABA4-like protein
MTDEQLFSMLNLMAVAAWLPLMLLPRARWTSTVLPVAVPALLAGWTHYLAFDLFIGGWEVRDAQARGIPHLLVVPALVLTFLFGPAGLLLYLAIRSWRRSGGQVLNQT